MLKAQPKANDSGCKTIKVAVFDLDGTLTFKDTYIEFLKLCLKRQPWRLLLGGNLVFYVLLYKAGIRSNHWLKARFLRTLAVGMSVEKFDRLCEEFSDQTIEKNLKPKSIAEMDRLRRDGYCLVLATASFDFYVLRIYEALNMDHLLCSKAEVDELGCITGGIEGKNCIGVEKSRRLEALSIQEGWTGIDRAYSDDRVDLPLFEMAEYAIVVDPGKSTTVLAAQRGWRVLEWR